MKTQIKQTNKNKIFLGQKLKNIYSEHHRNHLTGLIVVVDLKHHLPSWHWLFFSYQNISNFFLPYIERQHPIQNGFQCADNTKSTKK